ncbi:MAG: dTMP kinase [Gammaproteobacteria bacterium]|nr:MAG: dTMP kinase [Gammaproteobacteria bacterium]
MKKNGLFITFDGIDGAGKTTQIKMLAKFLGDQGKTVHMTREPGGTALSEKIRELLLAPRQSMSPTTELLLMFAARAEHIEKVLKPKVHAGEWVICSRFTDATLAYQGYARGVDLHKIQMLAEVVHGDFQPHISFFLDLPATLAAERRAGRGESVDRFEAEALSFMQAVREGYFSIAEAEPERCQVIDATQTIAQIQTAIQAVITPYLHEDSA